MQYKASELDLRTRPGEKRIAEIVYARTEVLQIKGHAEPRDHCGVVEDFHTALVADVEAEDGVQAVTQGLAERCVEEADADSIEIAAGNRRGAGDASVHEPAVQVRIAIGDEGLAEDTPALGGIAGALPQVLLEVPACVPGASLGVNRNVRRMRQDKPRQVCQVDFFLRALDPNQGLVAIPAGDLDGKPH